MLKYSKFKNETTNCLNLTNTAFLALLILEDGPKLQAFCNMVSFIEKVIHLDPLIVLYMPLSFNFNVLNFLTLCESKSDYV
jgi:hypothetical protein